MRQRFHDWFFGFSYTTRVTVTFSLVAIMTVVVAMGVLSYVWEEHFQAYTRENVQQLADTTAANIANRYERSNSATLSAIGEGNKMSYPSLSINDVEPAESVHMLQPGMGIQVISSSTETVVYDSSRPSGSSYSSSNSIDETGSFAPSDGKMASAAITLEDGQVVGTVQIWVYGSDLLLSKADQEFRMQSYQGMCLAAVLSVALASLIGILFARGLVRPINRITKTAQEIKEGNLSARVNLDGKDEIAELAKTFDAMAESVESNQELERRLTTDVAHELRTPLMAIQSTVEAIMDGVFEADEERLETVNGEVKRLSRLVDAILKLSRLENRSTPMKKEVLEVGDLISGIIATHDAYVTDSGLKLIYEVERGVRVRGDADMIRQATANLISNAVRYTPEGGTITVSVSSHEGMCAIAVRDTGIGLSPDEAKMVFSRFWRADAGRTRESGGLGIGLSVVKEIVDRHNGYVDVEGEKGVGACFTINLPLYYEGDEQREQRQQQRQQQQQQREQQMQQRQQQREAQRQQKEQQRAQQHAQKTGIPFGRSHDDGK